MNKLSRQSNARHLCGIAKAGILGAMYYTTKMRELLWCRLRDRRAFGMIAAVAALLAAPAAQAEILLHGQSSAALPAIDSATSVIVDGSTTFIFSTPGSPTTFTNVVIAFNAECGVEGGASNKLDLDVLLDPSGGTTAFSAVAPTSGSFNALCSGNGTAVNTDGLVTAEITVVTNPLPGGTHRLQIRATPNVTNGTGSGRIGARTLVVSR